MTEAALLGVVVLIVLAVAAPGTYWLYVAFAAMRGQLVDLRSDQGDLRDELARVEAALAISQERIRQLERAFREETGHEPPYVETPPARPTGAAGLARRIAARFSLDEVNGLAFELGLDGSLTGDSLENRSASLVKVAMQRDMLAQLVALCRRDRPAGGF